MILLYLAFSNGVDQLLEIDNLKFTIILIIIFNGFFLGFLIAAGQLIKDFKSLKTWLFLLLFVIFSLFQIHYIFFETDTLNRFKIINLFPIASYYLLGPLIFIITKHSLIEDYQPTKKDFSHFITPIAITLMSTTIIFSSNYEYTPQLHGYYYNEKLLALGGIGVLFFTAYLGFSVRDLIKSFMFSETVFKQNTFALAALSIVILMALALVLDVFAIVFNARFFMELSLFTLNLVIIALFFILFKYPDYEKAIQAVAKKEQRRRSYLVGINVDKLEERILQLIKQEDILSDENLNLKTMAQKAGVTKHQLSEFLNKNIGDNFSSFIKKHRINKAKQLLIQYPDRKILAIAFDVGFKSKSTFNAAFLFFEKVTPAQFRRQNQK